ncbi:MAG TPA: glycosyltransferase [Roseococcus sp.]|nr:glycosyltransferase [Roseococcus sp.]
MVTPAPRFSILLPTHNRADVLGFAIRSVLAQTEPDFELLIVADGCTDTTRDVVSAFADSRIRFFDLRKAPFFGYANRNTALREARGRLIAFAAHDDLLLPDHLEQMGALLDAEGTAWGYSQPAWVSTDGTIVPFGTNLTFADELRAFRERGNTIPAACVVHTRKALEQVGFWPEDVATAADWVLWRRMLTACGGKAAYLPVPTNLHFSADWKRSRHASSEEVRRLVAIADAAPWWPAILRQPAAGEPEQAAIWAALTYGGAPWVAALRAALSAVLDRVGWASLHPPAIGDEPLMQAIERLIAERDQALADTRLQALANVQAIERLTAERDQALADARLQALANAQAIERLTAERDQALEDATMLRRSTSWKVTAPLRAATRLLTHR